MSCNSCSTAGMLLIFIFMGTASLSHAQDQRFYFPNQQQGHFVQSFQNPDNGYFPQQVSPFRQNSPGFSQGDLLEGDLQTSDLPPNLAKTLPQYQYSTFVQPTVQHPVPFQLPSKNTNQDTYLYDDDNSSRNTNQQITRPQPFQPAPKLKSKQQPHSHYLTHNLHNHDPSQTETFLGQITLQSPDLHPDFNPDIPAFKPSKEFPFQHSPSLVDQFSHGTDKWRRPQNVPIGVPKPLRQRTSNKPFKELSDTVDQHLEDFLEKENHSREELHFRNRKPSIANIDRPGSNSVQSNTNSNYSSRFRSVPSSGREYKSRPQTNNFLVNNNGDVIVTTRHGFRPKGTTPSLPSTTVERRNRFHPTTKSPGRPLAFHLKSNKIPFAPRRTTTTSTTENNFDLESLLEDPIEDNAEHFEHDDDVEVIQSVTTTPTSEVTTEKEDSVTILTTESEKIIEQSTQDDNNSTITDSQEVETVDYPSETYHTSTSDTSTEDVKPTETESTLHDDDHDEYYDEYEDYETTNTGLSHTTVTENSKTTSAETIIASEISEENKTSSENVTDNVMISTTENDYSTSPDSKFDILTVVPSSEIRENDNFDHFVDSTLIDYNEEDKNALNSSESIISNKPTALPDTTVLNENNPVTTELPKVEPVLIGEAVVSVVTTKSVINGTYSIPTSAPQVTEQMKSPVTGKDSSSESWMVVASVQTSRSVSGARYLSFPIDEQDKRAQLLNEQPQEETNFDYTESNGQDSTSDIPTAESDEVKLSTPVSSTESISDKLDRVQSELSSGFLSGGFRNAIAVLTEQTPEKSTLMPSTTTVSSTTTLKPSSTSVPVVIRKFSPNLRPSTTERSRKRPTVFENIKMDDLSGLLPPGFKPKYQNSKTTTSTLSTVDLDLPQGDEPAKATDKSAEISFKNKVTLRDDVSSLLPPGYKVPKESDLPKDPVKTLEEILGKVRSEAARNNNKSRNNSKLETNKNLKEPSTTEKSKSIEELLVKAEPVDINAFLPPGYKLTTTTEKSKDISSLLAKAEPIDISSFLPPGYKPPKEDKSKTTSSPIIKPEPVDISSFLPPGYKTPKTENDSRKHEAKPEKSKGASGLLADAIPVDVSAFLPPGYKGRFSTPKPRIQSTQEVTMSKSEPSSTVASTIASSGGSKVVFPTRPGGRKPINRLTTPKSYNVEAPAATAPSIQKGWPSRATTEFTGWPTPSTTPISIEKLLEAARMAASLSSSSETPTVSVTTTTTSTTTTTTPAPTTPGICVGECDLAGTVKLIGGASWVPELLDHNTKEWQILANEVQTQLEKVYSKSAILSKWYKNIRIDEFSPGSVLVDYTVELTDLGRTVDTVELKSLFNEALNAAPAASARSIGKSENLRDERNATKLVLGSFIIDPQYTDFIVLSKSVIPTVGYAEDNVLLPQWAIAVIVIGLASLLFVIIFGVTVLVNRQKNAKKKQPIPLTEEMLNELNKNHMGGLDNYGAEDLYNMEDVWNDKGYDMKPPKKRSAGSIHDNSMSNLYDSWRSEWNGYYYNAYYGNTAGSSSNAGFTRRRSDYDTNF